MAYHLRLDFNLIKGFAIVVEGGAEADTPVKWCLSSWQRKGGLCKTDHDERRRWFPLVTAEKTKGSFLCWDEY
ncbi:hypothetical protein NC653_034670 [Populus alba x Populus x berolinensis]|uniref:Uncharacterized protein n=1 Tax=Populus alba x Populus x berolinensis TaxID=444605 RepID=A0AAD6LN32_9ROSI|nr:hypothetical protein NC653_034670 [Populus alba x Populus x berolinensis]